MPVMLLRIRTAAVAATAAVALVIALPVTASAQPGPFNGGGVNGGGTEIETEAGSTQPGNPPGTPATPVSNAGGSNTVPPPPPPCRYRYWLSGPAMAEYVRQFRIPMYPPPPPDWEQHAEDLNGAWYQPRCEFTSGTPDALDRRDQEFRNANPPRWFTSEPPPPPVPVEDLVERVRDSQGLPPLIVSTNPDAQSVVGLRTWVWPTAGEFGAVTSRSESGPNWAQVTATPGRISLTSTDPAAEIGSCATAPAWSQGADDNATDCYVTFQRSSAGRPGNAHTITAQMTWEIRLTTSDGRNELLASPPVVTDVPIPVAQVQSVLR